MVFSLFAIRYSPNPPRKSQRSIRMTARIDYAAVAPDLYKALIGAHTALKRSGFDTKLMDLVFQRVSQINGCAYCVDLHGRDLRAAGETPERLDGLAAWDESPYFSEREKAALAWAESVTHICDDARARSRLRRDAPAFLRGRRHTPDDCDRADERAQ